MKRLWLLVTLLVFLLGTSGWVVLTQWVVPAGLFRKAVLNPIPPSVKRIRGKDGRHANVLRFDINAEDVARVLAADDFGEIEYVEYNQGLLKYAESRFQGNSYIRYRSDGTISDVHEARGGMGGSFMLFTGWREWLGLTPRWFQLPQWRAPKAYAVERKNEDRDFYEVRLLIHNADVGQAYYIGYRVSGTW